MFSVLYISLDRSTLVLRFDGQATSYTMSLFVDSDGFGSVWGL